MHQLPSRERSETRLPVTAVQKAGKRSQVTRSSFGLTPPERCRKGHGSPCPNTEPAARPATPSPPPPTRNLRAHANFTPPRHTQPKRQPCGPNSGTLLSSALPSHGRQARPAAEEARGGAEEGGPRARGERQPSNGRLCGPGRAPLPCRRRRGCGPRRRGPGWARAPRRWRSPGALCCWRRRRAAAGCVP